MRILLKLNSETLVQARAELESFLGLEAKYPTNTVMMKSDAASPFHNRMTETMVVHPSAGDITSGSGTEKPSAQAPVMKNARARSAADIALGLDAGDGEDHPKNENEVDAEVLPQATADPVPVEDTPAPRSEAGSLLADKVQLQFDFNRVLALQGRAAALGIVRGVLPPGKQKGFKDVETLPVELIPAAIAALRAARAN
jgi:hypothetical protein